MTLYLSLQAVLLISWTVCTRAHIPRYSIGLPTQTGFPKFRFVNQQDPTLIGPVAFTTDHLSTTCVTKPDLSVAFNDPEGVLHRATVSLGIKTT